ncbi:fimbrial protein [Lelliottia amnigena]|uniref:Fimbrial protein n=1 Tax=Lelliottia amnigena TaxID=61646 RepID=A0ABU7U799_LELAM
MKKSILGLAVSTLFIVGAAQASVNPNDVSATLSVTGSVTHIVSCSVNISSPTVDLSADADQMVNQGDAGSTNVKTVSLRLTGSEECSDMAGQGKISYSFLGTKDSSAGTSLANSMTGANAAEGVGIALYNTANDNSIIALNQDTMLASADPAGIDLGLGLVKLNGQTVKAGSVQGSVTIQIERL